MDAVLNHISDNREFLIALLTLFAGLASIITLILHRRSRLEIPLKTLAIPLMMAAAVSMSIRVYDKYPHRHGIDNKIEELNSIQTSLNTLSEYVDRQKNNLRSISVAVEDLEKKRKLLEPIVDEKEEAMQAFVAAYRGDGGSVWLDRFIGFVLGIIGSVIATIITKSKYIHFKRK